MNTGISHFDNDPCHNQNCQSFCTWKKNKTTGMTGVQPSLLSEATLSDVLHPHFPWWDLPASLIQFRKSPDLPKKITPNWENPASPDNWNSKLQPLLVGFWFYKKKRFKVFSSRCVPLAKSFLMSFILQQSYLMLICPLPLEQ